MRKIIARFNSVCAETGKKLKKGDIILYDSNSKKAYHISVENNCKNDAAYVQAQEDAYWDRLTNGYYSS